ncbi:unnamed protein product, partial [Ectocarpus sp. 8 AP-2014]
MKATRGKGPLSPVAYPSRSRVRSFRELKEISAVPTKNVVTKSTENTHFINVHISLWLESRKRNQSSAGLEPRQPPGSCCGVPGVQKGYTFSLSLSPSTPGFRTDLC